MDTAASNLNVFKALTHSLSFCGDFVKKHWLISLINTANAVWTAYLMKDKTDNPNDILGLYANPIFDLNLLLNFIIALFVIYYVRRASMAHMVPTVQLANKSVMICAWQILCLQIVLFAASIPLFILLILPLFWWLVKTSLSYVNLACTEDGPIQSIKKSFQLTENNFWACLSYVGGIFFIVVVVVNAITIPASFALHASLMPSWEPAAIKQLLEALAIIFIAAISGYCETWLYVYLKAKHEAPVSYN